MGRMLLATVAALALMPGGRALAAQSYYYEMRTTRSVDNRPSAVTVKVWVNPPSQARMEARGKGRASVTVLNGTDVWLADPVRKEGIHRRGTAAQARQIGGALMSPGAEVASFIKQGGKKVGQESIGGVRCDKYVYVAKGGGDEMTHLLWVIPGKEHLRRRQESTGMVTVPGPMGQPARRRRIRSVTDFLNWRMGAPMPASLFRPPSGIKFQEASANPPLPSGHPPVPGPGSGRPPVGGGRPRP